MGTGLQPPTDTRHPALPDIQWARWVFSLSLAQPFGIPHPLQTPSRPLVLTSYQPRVQRVKARLCEQGMRDRREGNPLRGRGKPARGSQTCPGGPGPLIRVGPCQLLGRLQAWVCVCVCAVIALQVN